MMMIILLSTWLWDIFSVEHAKMIIDKMFNQIEWKADRLKMITLRYVYQNFNKNAEKYIDMHASHMWLIIIFTRWFQINNHLNLDFLAYKRERAASFLDVNIMGKH